MFKKSHWWIILGIVLANYAAINYCVYAGSFKENVSHLFQEREAATFLSALQLGIICILSICIYLIKRTLYKKDVQSLKQIKVWLFSFIVTAFATADEFFMIHEGIDSGIATLFCGMEKNPQLDGLVLGLYGLVAIILFFIFKKEILKYKEAILLFVICGFFFSLSIMLDLKSTDQFKMILEESLKLFAIGFLLSGYVAIFSDVIKELDLRLGN